MNKYNKSKIYKIVDDTNGNIYIGSTIEKYISNRLGGHKKSYKYFLKHKGKYTTSFEILKNNSFHIELIEECNFNNKMELHRREGEYIRDNECVNKNIPGRSMKDYRENNKDKIREYVKEYYKNNNDKIKKVSKEYYKNNTDKKNEYSKEYYKNNTDKLNELNKKNREYKNSWCGDPRRNNNLLLISMDLFN